MKKKKEWLHYNVQYHGECEATCNGEPWHGRYEIGIVESGKSRVYEGLFAKLIGPDGREWIGHSRWSLITAARESFQKTANSGVHLVCAGLDEHWYTTGLSDGTGYGYLRGREDEGPFHMMDQSDKN